MTKLETHHLEDGQIYLSRNLDISPYWQARVKKPDGSGYLRKSTSQEQLDSAKLWAMRELDKMKLRMQMGLTLNTHTFAQACKLWEDWLDAEIAAGLQKAWKAKQYKAVVRRYFIPYFGEKDIGAIRQADLLAFKEWRVKYWISGPGAGQKMSYKNKKGRTVTTKIIHGNGVVRSGERSIFNAIMERAVAAGWITEDKVPSWPKRRGRQPDMARVVRPCFTLNEYKLIIEKVNQWPFKNDIPEIVRRYRMALRDYVIVMLNTGMRPHEAMDMKWKHVATFEQEMPTGTAQKNVKLSVTGKTGARDLVGGQEVLFALTRIQMWMEDGVTTGPDDYIFRLPNGERCKLADSFKTFLAAHDLTYDAMGKARTPYSMRHTYATLKLLYSPGISYGELAIQMGTSPEMIEKHYAHLIPQQIAAKLTHSKYGKLEMRVDGSLSEIAA